MKIGNIDSKNIDTLWQVVYDSGELAAAVASITISGLTGNSDEEYHLICRFVDDDTTGGYYLRFNNDSGNNYGYQYLKAATTTLSAVRDTSEAQIDLGYTNTDGNICFSEHFIYAKSGYPRTVISMTSEDIATDIIASQKIIGQSWNNTADEITSMVIGALADKMNIGSRIILLKKVKLTSGINTGNLDIRGILKNTWENLYETTIAAAVVTEQYLDTTDSNLPLWGATGSFEADAQGFKVPTTDNITQVDIRLKKWVSPTDNLVLRIETDSSGVPSGTLADANATKSIAMSTVTTSYSYIAFVFDTPFSLTVGTQYHLVLGRSGARDETNFVCWGRDDSTAYTNGNCSEKHSGTWSARPNNDNGFKLYQGGACTSVTITGLNGNTDVLYRITARSTTSLNVTNGGTLLLRPNNDSGDNYGYQRIRGSDEGTINADGGGGYYAFDFGVANAGDPYEFALSFARCIMYAKSGYVRTGMSVMPSTMRGTSSGQLWFRVQVWDNTADNITTISITANKANSLGIGTYFSLERLNL